MSCRKTHLSLRPMLSRYWRELLPSQIWMPLTLRVLAFVSPLRNQSSSSATPTLSLTSAVRWRLADRCLWYFQSEFAYSFALGKIGRITVSWINLIMLSEAVFALCYAWRTLQFLEFAFCCKQPLERTYFACLKWALSILEENLCIFDVDIVIKQSANLHLDTDLTSRCCSQARRESTSPKDFLCGQQRETVAQIIFHLGTKLGEGSSAGPIFPESSVVNDILHHVQVLLRKTANQPHLASF